MWHWMKRRKKCGRHFRGAGEEVKRFEACLLDLQKRLDQSNKELEQLMGVRLRKLKKKLEYFDI